MAVAIFCLNFKYHESISRKQISFLDLRLRSNSPFHEGDIGQLFPTQFSVSIIFFFFFAAIQFLLIQWKHNATTWLLIKTANFTSGKWISIAFEINWNTFDVKDNGNGLAEKGKRTVLINRLGALNEKKERLGKVIEILLLSPVDEEE